jgi:hypothetical protein
MGSVNFLIGGLRGKLDENINISFTILFSLYYSRIAFGKIGRYLLSAGPLDDTNATRL